MELREKCSEALAEYRGRYEVISERTIRDDIRVMRSDILGYNAPIEQQKGLYFYSDPRYSIMTISFTDSNLIERIIMFLDTIKSEVSHPELEIILDKLSNLKYQNHFGDKESAEIQVRMKSERLSTDQLSEKASDQFRKPKRVKASGRRIFRIEESDISMAPSLSIPLHKDLNTWGDLFLLLPGLA